MKKAKTITRLSIFATLGIYIGKWIWLFYDYSVNSGLYEVFSAPWYTEMIPWSFLFAILLVIEIIAYIFFNKKSR